MIFYFLLIVACKKIREYILETFIQITNITKLTNNYRVRGVLSIIVSSRRVIAIYYYHTVSYETLYTIYVYKVS